MEERQRITEKVAAAKEKTKASEKRQNQGDVRDIGDFEYDKSKAKVLKKALHNISVSVGTLLAAMKELAMLRGSDITPDGKLGGKGFIMPFKEMKATLNNAISELSDITDTIGDELTNPRWGLSDKEVKNIKKEQDVVEEKSEEADKTLEKPVENKEEDTQSEDIQPEDVKDALEIQSKNRYKSLLEGPPSADKTARDLSKNILANLVRGE